MKAKKNPFFSGLMPLWLWGICCVFGFLSNGTIVSALESRSANKAELPQKELKTNNIPTFSTKEIPFILVHSEEELEHPQFSNYLLLDAQTVKNLLNSTASQSDPYHLFDTYIKITDRTEHLLQKFDHNSQQYSYEFGKEYGTSTLPSLEGMPLENIPLTTFMRAANWISHGSPEGNENENSTENGIYDLVTNISEKASIPTNDNDQESLPQQCYMLTPDGTTPLKTVEEVENIYGNSPIAPSPSPSQKNIEDLSGFQKKDPAMLAATAASRYHSNTESGIWQALLYTGLTCGGVYATSQLYEYFNPRGRSLELLPAEKLEGEMNSSFTQRGGRTLQENGISSRKNTTTTISNASYLETNPQNPEMNSTQTSFIRSSLESGRMTSGIVTEHEHPATSFSDNENNIFQGLLLNDWDSSHLTSVNNPGQRREIKTLEENKRLQLHRVAMDQKAETFFQNNLQAISAVPYELTNTFQEKAAELAEKKLEIVNSAESSEVKEKNLSQLDITLVDGWIQSLQEWQTTLGEENPTSLLKNNLIEFIRQVSFIDESDIISWLSTAPERKNEILTKLRKSTEALRAFESLQSMELLQSKLLEYRDKPSDTTILDHLNSSAATSPMRAILFPTLTTLEDSNSQREVLEQINAIQDHIQKSMEESHKGELETVNSAEKSLTEYLDFLHSMPLECQRYSTQTQEELLSIKEFIKTLKTKLNNQSFFNKTTRDEIKTNSTLLSFLAKKNISSQTLLTTPSLGLLNNIEKMIQSALKEDDIILIDSFMKQLKQKSLDTSTINKLLDTNIISFVIENNYITYQDINSWSSLEQNYKDQCLHNMRTFACEVYSLEFFENIRFIKSTLLKLKMSSSSAEKEEAEKTLRNFVQKCLDEKTRMSQEERKPPSLNALECLLNSVGYVHLEVLLHSQVAQEKVLNKAIRSDMQACEIQCIKANQQLEDTLKTPGGTAIIEAFKQSRLKENPNAAAPSLFYLDFEKESNLSESSGSSGGTTTNSSVSAEEKKISSYRFEVPMSRTDTLNRLEGELHQKTTQLTKRIHEIGRMLTPSSETTLKDQLLTMQHCIGELRWYDSTGKELITAYRNQELEKQTIRESRTNSFFHDRVGLYSPIDTDREALLIFLEDITKKGIEIPILSTFETISSSSLPKGSVDPETIRVAIFNLNFFLELKRLLAQNSEEERLLSKKSKFSKPYTTKLWRVRFPLDDKVRVSRNTAAVLQKSIQKSSAAVLQKSIQESFDENTKARILIKQKLEKLKEVFLLKSKNKILDLVSNLEDLLENRSITSSSDNLQRFISDHIDELTNIIDCLNLKRENLLCLREIVTNFNNNNINHFFQNIVILKDNLLEEIETLRGESGSRLVRAAPFKENRYEDPTLDSVAAVRKPSPEGEELAGELEDVMTLLKGVVPKRHIEKTISDLCQSINKDQLFGSESKLANILKALENNRSNTPLVKLAANTYQHVANQLKNYLASNKPENIIKQLLVIEKHLRFQENPKDRQQKDLEKLAAQLDALEYSITLPESDGTPQKPQKVKSIKDQLEQIKSSLRGLNMGKVGADIDSSTNKNKEALQNILSKRLDALEKSYQRKKELMAIKQKYEELYKKQEELEYRRATLQRLNASISKQFHLLEKFIDSNEAAKFGENELTLYQEKIEEINSNLQGLRKNRDFEQPWCQKYINELLESFEAAFQPVTQLLELIQKQKLNEQDLQDLETTNPNNKRIPEIKDELSRIKENIKNIVRPKEEEEKSPELDNIDLNQVTAHQENIFSLLKDCYTSEEWEEFYALGKQFFDQLQKESDSRSEVSRETYKNILSRIKEKLLADRKAEAPSLPRVNSIKDEFFIDQLIWHLLHNSETIKFDAESFLKEKVTTIIQKIVFQDLLEREKRNIKANLIQKLNFFNQQKSALENNLRQLQTYLGITPPQESSRKGLWDSFAPEDRSTIGSLSPEEIKLWLDRLPGATGNLVREHHEKYKARDSAASTSSPLFEPTMEEIAHLLIDENIITHRNLPLLQDNEIKGSLSRILSVPATLENFINVIKKCFAEKMSSSMEANQKLSEYLRIQLGEKTGSIVARELQTFPYEIKLDSVSSTIDSLKAAHRESHASITHEKETLAAEMKETLDSMKQSAEKQSIREELEQMQKRVEGLEQKQEELIRLKNEKINLLNIEIARQEALNQELIEQQKQYRDSEPSSSFISYQNSMSRKITLLKKSRDELIKQCEEEEKALEERVYEIKIKLKNLEDILHNKHTVVQKESAQDDEEVLSLDHDAALWPIGISPNYGDWDNSTIASRDESRAFSYVMPSIQEAQRLHKTVENAEVTLPQNLEALIEKAARLTRKTKNKTLPRLEHRVEGAFPTSLREKKESLAKEAKEVSLNLSLSESRRIPTLKEIEKTECWDFLDPQLNSSTMSTKSSRLIRPLSSFQKDRALERAFDPGVLATKLSQVESRPSTPTSSQLYSQTSSAETTRDSSLNSKGSNTPQSVESLYQLSSPESFPYQRHNQQDPSLNSGEEVKKKLHPLLPLTNLDNLRNSKSLLSFIEKHDYKELYPQYSFDMWSTGATKNGLTQLLLDQNSLEHDLSLTTLEDQIDRNTEVVRVRRLSPNNSYTQLRHQYLQLSNRYLFLQTSLLVNRLALQLYQKGGSLKNAALTTFSDWLQETASSLPDSNPNATRLLNSYSDHLFMLKVLLGELSKTDHTHLAFYTSISSEEQLNQSIRLLDDVTKRLSLLNPPEKREGSSSESRKSLPIPIPQLRQVNQHSLKPGVAFSCPDQRSFLPTIQEEGYDTLTQSDMSSSAGKGEKEYVTIPEQLQQNIKETLKTLKEMEQDLFDQSHSKWRVAKKYQYTQEEPIYSRKATTPPSWH